MAHDSLDKSGVKLIGTGDVTDDDLLADIGDSALGAVTTHHHSAAQRAERKQSGRKVELPPFGTWRLSK